MSEKQSIVAQFTAEQLKAKQSLSAQFRYWIKRREAISGPNPSDGRFMEMSVLDGHIRKNLPELLDKMEKYEKAAQFYANKANWTTSDNEENHFIKVSDPDWENREEGGFVGGKMAREALK